jgi:hypothetical protein
LSVPEKLDAVYTAVNDWTVLSGFAFVGAEDVGNVAKPFRFSVYFTFVEPVLDQPGIDSIDELLVVHHPGCRMVGIISFIATNCTSSIYRVRSLDHCRGCPAGLEMDS